MAATANDGVWKNCNLCKAPVAFGAEYFVCSVSTCNRKRTGLLFCSLSCFEAHLPTARHRDAWAEREHAPSRAEWQAALAAAETDAGAEPAAARPQERSGGAEQPVRRVVEARPTVTPGATPGVPAGASPAPAESAEALDVLVVVSKLKKYVRDWSGMNTSDGAVSILSDHLRELCRDATRQAGLEGRRTVLDRDFTKVLAERREARRLGSF
jgi:histone H3/H4